VVKKFLKPWKSRSGRSIFLFSEFKRNKQRLLLKSNAWDDTTALIALSQRAGFGTPYQ
jgi:hypothetical protein